MHISVAYIIAYINADQNYGIDPNVDQFRSFLINVDQCQLRYREGSRDLGLFLVLSNWTISIDRHWALIHSKTHHFPPNRYIYLHHSNSWQLLTVMQIFALEQNFCVQASRYFVLYVPSSR